MSRGPGIVMRKVKAILDARKSGDIDIHEMVRRVYRDEDNPYYEPRPTEARINAIRRAFDALLLDGWERTCRKYVGSPTPNSNGSAVRGHITSFHHMKRHTDYIRARLAGKNIHDAVPDFVPRDEMWMNREARIKARNKVFYAKQEARRAKLAPGMPNNA